MFNKKLFPLFVLTAAVTLSGCGSKKESEPEPVIPETEMIFETNEVSESEEELEPITPADYLVKDVSQYVTLGSLDNLSATQNVYDVTDELLQERIEEELYMYSEDVEAEKVSEGSTVYADITYSVEGSEDPESTESTYLTIGDEDYGAEFDAQLIGKTVGDELSFSISYDEDVWYEEWIDQTVNFKVTVTGIYDTVVPEYDEKFVTENTEYASKEEYEESLSATMEEEYAQEGYSEAIDSLFQSVMDNSTFNGYPEDLYTECENESISYYGQFLGTDDRDEILEALGLTTEDLEAEVLDSVNLRLTICAICEAQGLEVSEDDYISEVTESAATYGYLSPVEYEEVNGRENIVWSLYQNKVAEFLYDKAEITPVEASVDDLYGDEFIEVETEEETFGADEIYAAELETEE